MNVFRDRFDRSPEVFVGQCSVSATTTLFCSFCFFLAIAGYPIAMALLSPWGMGVDLALGENRMFTWTYRVFSLLVSLIALSRVYSRPIPRFDWRMFLLGAFWLLYICRAFWDLQISPPVGPLAWNWAPGIEFQAWCYIFLFTLLPMIVTIKSVNLIDFRRVQSWIFYLGGVGVVCALWANHSHSTASWSILEGRTSASAMLNTISYGHLGLTVAIIAGCRLLERKSLFRWGSCSGLALLGLYAMLQAGSRGPLLALFMVVLIYAFSKSRYAAIGIFLVGIFVSTIWLFIHQIIGLVRNFSPTMASRLEMTIIGGDTGGREELFSAVWDECLRNPLTGFQLDFLGYSHNICLDGIMMFGLVFGWIVLAIVILGYKAAYDALKHQKTMVWIPLIAVQYITAAQTSGMFGPNATIQCLLIVLFLMTRQKNLQPPTNHFLGSNAKVR